MAEKFREVIGSVLPFAVIVVLLHALVTPLEGPVLGRFLIGALFITVGMPIFLQGIDVSISPMGEMISQSMIKTGRLQIVLLGSFLIGFIVTVAEPDMHILGSQVASVTDGQVGRFLLVLVVSLGVGLLVSLGILRMLHAIPLNRVLPLVYLLVCGLALFVNGDFLAIAFDANGSTTGSITVPFLLALSTGITAMTRSKRNEDIDSFGLLGVASAGAVVTVLILGILSGNPTLTGSLPAPEARTTGAFSPFLQKVPPTALESALVLLPVILFMAIVNRLSLHLKVRQIRKLATGLFYSWFGLTLFLTGVNAGFLEAAQRLGYQIAALDRNWLLILVGIVFGVVTIPAEPSVHVLTRQIEDETAGSIKARTVMLTLSIGVGAAVGLSVLRIIIPWLQLWHILLPGMVIALILSFFIKPIFVGVAFDSGGVASGTMTATFILPFAQGAAERMPTANVVTDAFGVIAVVAVVPLIALQVLGLIYEFNLRKAERLLLAESIADEPPVPSELAREPSWAKSKSEPIASEPERPEPELPEPVSAPKSPEPEPESKPEPMLEAKIPESESPEPAPEPEPVPIPEAPPEGAPHEAPPEELPHEAPLTEQPEPPQPTGLSGKTAHAEQQSGEEERDAGS